MKKFAKILLRIFLGFIALLACIFLVLFIKTGGDYTVPKTVAQDNSLPRVTVNGVTLHAEAFGNPQNRAVIAIHGGPGNDYRCLLSLKKLSDAYYIVFYDQRGSGLSPRVPEKEISQENMISDLDGIVTHYGKGKKVNLIGHSWGGMLASAYIGKYPGKVHRAVLAEPGFLNADMADIFMKKTNYMMPKNRVKALPHLIMAWVRSLHVKGPDDQARADFFMESLIYGMNTPDNPIAGYFCNQDLRRGSLDYWRFGSLVSRTMLSAGFDGNKRLRYDLSKGVGQFKNEVLFLAGDCNIIIGPDYQRKQMALFPRAKLVIIKDAGHSMIGEKPEETNRIVREYFK
jgi:proline iminopeptidase